MPGVRVENSPKFANRTRDISSWQEGDISLLSSREKKRYNKRKSAIAEYFTTEAPIEEIALRHRLSTGTLSQLAENCLMQHEDGQPWGYRALLPGVTVIDYAEAERRGVIHHAPTDKIIHAPAVEDKDAMHAAPDTSKAAEAEQSAILVDAGVADDDDDTAKRRAVKLSPVCSTQVLETPLPPFIEDEEEEEVTGRGQAIAPTMDDLRQPLVHSRGDPCGRPGVGPSMDDLRQPLVHSRGDPCGRPGVGPSPRNLAAATAPLVIPISVMPRSSIPARGTTLRRMRKRWQRGVHDQHKHKHFRRMVSFVILAAVLLFVLVPAAAGLAAYGTYNNLNAVTHDGINHLLDVKSIFSASKSDPTAALTAKNLEQAHVDFKAAESDFVQLQQLVNRPDVQGVITQFAPQYAGKLGMAQSLVQVALDVSRMGDELSGIALIGANIIHGSPLAAGSTKPLISAADVQAIEGSMVHALYYIDDIQAQMQHLSVKDLPISDAQKTQLNSVLPLLPRAKDMILQAQSLLPLISWLLGVGHERRFLIQTMDRAELRPGGGFTGQYGILHISDGRMAPLTLTDVTLIDYAENGTAIGRTAPPGYSWMNFGNWGVRDSNLSGDFPTTARMTMQVFQDEGGGPLDGAIAFTTTVIGHILDETGPIKVPGYNETITSKNLEEKIHLYQQDFSAIAREKQISGNYSHAGRKAFTSTLGKMLLDRMRHLPVKQLLTVMKGAIKDIQSRDLEIYFTDPAAEDWLVQHGYSGSIDTFAKQDGFMVVQANISISKASEYVHTTEHDDVTLDAHGGATHNLTITLDYQQKGPVYGYDTYADYIRVYAPKSATFISGDGFDTEHALCKPGAPVVAKGTPTPDIGTPPPATGCGQYNSSFPSDARYCPNGNYALGQRGYISGVGFTNWPIDSLGPPTAQTSDLPNRAMWGGLTETPKNCISYITVSWYVPHTVQRVNGRPSYTILVQKQSGYYPTIELTIDASVIKGPKSFKFSGNIYADKAFTLSPPPPQRR